MRKSTLALAALITLIATQSWAEDGSNRAQQMNDQFRVSQAALWKSGDADPSVAHAAQKDAKPQVASD